MHQCQLAGSLTRLLLMGSGHAAKSDVLVYLQGICLVLACAVELEVHADVEGMNHAVLVGEVPANLSSLKSIEVPSRGLLVPAPGAEAVLRLGQHPC